MGTETESAHGAGGSLPRHHVPRPRLVAQVQRAPVAVVAAGGGYGKTLLALEAARALRVASVNVLLGAGDHGPAALISRMISALRRARLSELAAAVRAEQGDPAAAVDALAAALEREPGEVLLIVDDAHQADGPARALLARLTRSLPGEHRLMILGRLASEAFELAANAELVSVSADQLAFTSDETVDLCRGLGVELGPQDARALVRATAGWPAALVLVAQTLSRSAHPDAALAEIVERRHPLKHLVDRQLAVLTEDELRGLAQLAHLPLLSPAVAEAVTGDRQLLERAQAAGLPLSTRPDGWRELPGPVQEHIARQAPLQAATALAVAPVYAGRGELSAAVGVLLEAGEDMAAAELLARMSPQEADDLGYLELQTLIDALADSAVEAHPGVLVHLARACEPAARVRVRADALERARTLALRAGDRRMASAIDAERARDLVRDGLAAEGEQLASRVLAELGPGELTTRARALDAVGRAAAWRRDEASLVRAERLLRECRELCERLGLRGWAAQVTMPLAHGVLYARGDHRAALELIEQTLGALPGRSRHRGVILSFYADILIDCGRFTDAEPIIEEEWRLGELLADHRICAYAAWSGAKLASQVGDREGTLRRIRAVESRRDDWFAHSTGAAFLADAADLLERVGETELALDYLARARRRRRESPLAVAVAEAAVLARSGDADQAERVLARIDRLPRLEPRERWRMALLRAYAGLRRGDPRAGALAARAFDLAAAISAPQLPLVRDRAVAERLIELAATCGSAAAAGLRSAPPPLTLSVLGRFELRRGGEPVRIPPGKPEQLVKLLAVSGRRLPAEQAIEELWPEVEPLSGRKRLRNALNRLHAAAPDLARRDGELLDLGNVEVDAELFEQRARRVLDGAERASARLVLSGYRGPLLPGDLYEPWAAAPRERLQRLFVAVLDAAAEGAEAAGEIDEALRLIERALELEPFDERRYLTGARLLLAQGRRAAALALLERGRDALRRLGVPISPAHEQLAADARR
ncbi:MAG TPA: BTAD domain-containing putative transcriptional regulator [Solirubrobacteraceae bacterium]|nr:BTAD domain-containing putative transcriptional regulator [Solirubrobacteraceae bacterium]